MSRSERDRARQASAEHDRLRELVTRMRQGGPAALGSADLLELPRLYRRACTDLARTRAAGNRHADARKLNDLVADAHGLIYAAPPRRAGALLGFLRSGFPSLVRATGRFHLLAAAALFLPLVLAWIAVAEDPARAPYLAPDVAGFVEEADQAFGADFGRVSRETDASTLMTSFYVTNNTKVALMCFAAGILFGLGSLLMLVYNGVVIGTVAGVLHDRGLAGNFLAFISAHGPIELAGIVISGGAGLALGHALLEPTSRPRREHLARRAREVVRLLLGVAMLMALAAPIEGFVSSSSLPNTVKYGIGVLHLVLVLTYLLAAGRVEREEKPG